MEPPPEELDGARVLLFAEITDAVIATGRTTHQVDGQVFDNPRFLAICQYVGDTDFYLFYCDKHWEVVTDTCHQNLEDAKYQAEFEYSGITAHWRQAE